MIGGGRRTKDRGGKPKRMTIRLNKAKPKLPDDFLAQSWEKLEEAVNMIHTMQPVKHSREELYHMVEGLCMHKQSGELCKRLEVVLDKHIKSTIFELVNQTPDHLAFLSLVTNTWQNHCQQMQSIRNLFLYLDRSYIISDTTLKSLWDIGLRMFRRYLQQVPDVEEKIISGFLYLIQRERSGEAITLSICTNIMRMLVSLHLYEDRFEKRFLEESCAFYQEESLRLIDQTQVPDYLLHVEKRLREEKLRVTRYLDPQTRLPLVRTCERELITHHVPNLLEKGFDSLMKERRTEDIGRMYDLFTHVNALSDIKVSLAAYTKRRGLQIVQNEGEEKEMVPSLLRFKEDLDDLLKTAMHSNETMERAVRDSFENFINSRENKPAELIAKYIDVQLRSGGSVKGLGNEEEVEARLEKVVVLFRYLQAKDVFEAFYKKDLSKRLLLARSASSDLERSMIAKLKTECGSNFTNKLEGMFKDMGISKDLMAKFEVSQWYSERPISEVSVYVLTTGFWPAYPMMKSLVLPPIITQSQQLFEKFYLSKYEGRRLSWQPSLCHLLLKSDFPRGKKELLVSLYQSLVLMLFNACSSIEDKLSFHDIKERTGIEDGELRRTLISLSAGKAKVVLKLPKGREVNDTDKFMINAEFKSDKYRIKINSIQHKETKKENTETHERVFEDRQYQIDAAIVRIMKARKTLSHTLLMSELIKQLRFPSKPTDLKRRVESLIEREYIERAPDPNTYQYLA